jgi:hypothetical protein
LASGWVQPTRKLWQEIKGRKERQVRILFSHILLCRATIWK